MGIVFNKLITPKIEKGVRVLTDLRLQGFSIAEIDQAIRWTLGRRDHFQRKLFSIAMLPQVIGQALNQDQRFDKKLERVKHEEAGREQETEKKIRAQQAAAFASLSAEEQTAYVQRASENLLKQGFKQEFLFEPIVKSKVLRLIGEKQEVLDYAEDDE